MAAVYEEVVTSTGEQPSSDSTEASLIQAALEDLQSR